LTSGSEPDPYVVLGVPRSASPAEIRAAYQALVRKYHPDLHQGNPLEDLAGARLAEINRAYEILGDASRRAGYDAGRTSAPNGAPTRPAPSKRLIMIALLVASIPLVLRAGAVAIRGAVRLGRALFAMTASFPGGRPTAALVLALAILAAALRLRRRSGDDHR